MTKKLIIGDVSKPDGDEWVSVDARISANYTILINENTVLDMFDSGSIDLIYSSHLIEHLTDEAVRQLFSEAYRILRKRGGLRIVAPDALYYIDSYRTNEQAAFFEDEYVVGEGRTYCEEIGLEAGNPAILETHNLLCTMFCCYGNYPRYCHVFDKAEVEERLKGDIDKFISWCSSHYNRARSGGHCNGFYSGKVMRMMREVGFREVFDMGFRRSNFEEVTLSAKLDLELRRSNSFYVEVLR